MFIWIKRLFKRKDAGPVKSFPGETTVTRGARRDRVHVQIVDYSPEALALYYGKPDPVDVGDIWAGVGYVKEDHTNGPNQAPVGKADGAFPHLDHVLRLQGAPVGNAGDGAQGGEGAHDDAGAPAGMGGEGGRLAATLRELMERELQSREVIIVGSSPGVQIVGPPSLPLSEVDPHTQELVRRIKASQRRMAERREGDERK